MASTYVYYQSDGSKSTSAALANHHQVKAMAAAGSIFVYGGDVYDNGTDADFVLFDNTYSDVLPNLCETAGNHDWKTANCAGYDKYWGARQPPASLTVINNNQGTTIPDHHHYKQPLGNGWLGIFVDSGNSTASQPLTSFALNLIDGWITAHGSRSIIVFTHWNRLSRGNHDNNTSIDPLWQKCFDSTGAPRVAAWVSGHNHNMGIYTPRAKGSGASSDPPISSKGIDNGIQMFNNGAGGAGHYSFTGVGQVGTQPDIFGNDSHFGFLQITFTDSSNVSFQNYDTGINGSTGPVTIGPLVSLNIGSSTQPTASLSTTSLTFPNTDPGSNSTTQNVTLTNTGGGTLTIPSGGITLTGTNASKFSIVSGAASSPINLTSNQNTVVGVRFSPSISDTRGTTFTAQLQFTDNSGGVTGSTQNVSLTGTVTPANPIATLSASSLSFSVAAGSTSSPQTITVTNTGNSPLHMTAAPNGLVLTGTNANLFQITNDGISGATIAVNSSASANIIFSPPAGTTGSKTATLTINDDSGGTASAQTVSLLGTETATNGVGTLNPTSVNFGNVTAGSASNPVTVTITNTGGNPSTLTIASVSIIGTQFTIFSDTGQTSLAFNASRTIQVKFNPNSGSTGTLNATLRITDNSGGVANTNQDVPLTGTAVAVGTGTATITPNPVVFPDTIVTQTSKQVVTIQNTGTGNLTISGAVIS